MDLPRGYWDSYLIVGKAPAPQRGKTLVTFAEAKARISISIGVQALAFSVRLENVNSLKALSNKHFGESALPRMAEEG